MTGCNDMGHYSSDPQAPVAPFPCCCPGCHQLSNLAVEENWEINASPGCVCALMGVTLQWRGWSLAMSPMRPPLLILGHPPGGRWHPLFVPWDWLMFCGTEQGSVLVGWLIFFWSSFNSFPSSPLVWSFSWMTLFNFSAFFQICWGKFLYFRICCCPWSTCCFRRQIERVVKAGSGLSTLLSARDVLELKTPHPISKVAPFPALKTSACFSGLLQGAAFLIAKCHKADKNNVQQKQLGDFKSSNTAAGDSFLPFAARTNFSLPKGAAGLVLGRGVLLPQVEGDPEASLRSSKVKPF